MARRKKRESGKIRPFFSTPKESEKKDQEKGRLFPELPRSRGKYRNSKKYRSREKSVEVLLISSKYY